MRTAEEFWARVDRRGPDECWEWKEGRTTRGYGLACWGPPRARRYAHRLAFEIANERPIGPGLVVRHRCDNRGCCNPAHLIEGMIADNQRDMVERGRSTSGERHQWAVLNAEHVREIDRLLKAGLSRRQIAEQFAVTRGTIGYIARGESWRRTLGLAP